MKDLFITGKGALKGKTIDAMVVDDDPIACTVASIMLNELGYSARTACTTVDAFFHFQRSPCRLILADYNTEVINGCQLAQRIKFQFPKTHVIIMTGADRHMVAELMKDKGVDGYLFKPFNADDLKTMLSSIGLSPVAADRFCAVK